MHEQLQLAKDGRNKIEYFHLKEIEETKERQETTSCIITTPRNVLDRSPDMTKNS